LKFILQLNHKGKTKLVHHNKMKPYLDINPPKWILKTKSRISNDM